jgi:hypothetical protein
MVKIYLVNSALMLVCSLVVDGVTVVVCSNSQLPKVSLSTSSGVDSGFGGSRALEDVENDSNH